MIDPSSFAFSHTLPFVIVAIAFAISFLFSSFIAFSSLIIYLIYAIAHAKSSVYTKKSAKSLQKSIDFLFSRHIIIDMRSKNIRKVRHFDVTLTDAEIAALKKVKESGISYYRFVRDAIVEKLAREGKGEA